MGRWLGGLLRGRCLHFQHSHVSWLEEGDSRTFARDSTETPQQGNPHRIHNDRLHRSYLRQFPCVLLFDKVGRDHGFGCWTSGGTTLSANRGQFFELISEDGL